jgi:hypothetical protein
VVTWCDGVSIFSLCAAKCTDNECLHCSSWWGNSQFFKHFPPFNASVGSSGSHKEFRRRRKQRMQQRPECQSLSLSLSLMCQLYCSLHFALLALCLSRRQRDRTKRFAGMAAMLVMAHNAVEADSRDALCNFHFSHLADLWET